MPESPGRFNWVVGVAKVWAIAAMAFLGLSFVYVVYKLILALSPFDPAHLAGWVVSLAGLVAAGVAVVVLYGLIEALVLSEPGAQAVVDRLKRLESVLEALHESDRRLVDLAQMSDQAKSLLFRQRELEAMNEMLHEMLLRQDYARAEALVGDIARGVGFAQQVEQMRAEIAAARQTTVDQKIESAVERINRLMADHDWTQALRQSHRLALLVGDNARVAALPEHIRNARAAHKRQLLQIYDEAVKAGDVDRSIDLLRELDKYLTPQEGAAMQESARSVFRTKLHNLGVQFALRATEQNWTEAVAIGEQIIREYPNSRMAQEAQLKMDSLKALAEQQAAKK